MPRPRKQDGVTEKIDPKHEGVHGLASGESHKKHTRYCVLPDSGVK